MSNETLVELLHRSVVVHKAKVMSIEPHGVIFVSAPAESSGVLPCRMLKTGTSAPAVAPGDSVIYLLSEEDPGLGYILGVIDRESIERETPRQAPPERLVLEGENEVVLRAGRATIVLRSNGDVEIRGKRIVSRARDLQKLSAPMLKLN